MHPNNIPVIIPAYEPDEKLLDLLHDLRADGWEKIVVVDDGSKEGYAHIFDRAVADYQVELLVHAENKGKGRALKTAFAYCLEKYRDCVGVVTADSDGQHSPACIFSCGEALLNHPNALVLGCRCFDQENVPKKSEFGNKLTRRILKYMTGLNISDTQTGLRGISVDFMEALLHVPGERYEFETNMLLESKSLHIPIVEVPIETIYIEGNASSHFNPIKDSIKIYMIFVRFLLSSLSSSIVDMVLFGLLCYVFKNRNGFADSYIVVSTVLARIVSAFYNYSVNYKLVFKSEGGVMRTLPKYAFLAIVQMSLSAFLVNYLYPLIGGFEVFVKIPVDVFLFFLSYVVQREFVYVGKKHD